MGGEKGREHHDVAEQKDPEAESDDHALGGRPAFPVTCCIHVSNANASLAEPITAAPDPIRIDGPSQRGVRRAHAGSLARACCASHCSRACRRARSRRATSAAGIEYSTTSRHANHTNTAKAPTKPRPTIHQMCQISAKPVIVQKNAVMNPVGLFLGTSSGSYLGSGDNC